jgi:hypothetical protein
VYIYNLNYKIHIYSARCIATEKFSFSVLITSSLKYSAHVLSMVGLNSFLINDRDVRSHMNSRKHNSTCTKQYIF